MKLTICISISVGSQARLHDYHGLIALVGCYLIMQEEQVTLTLLDPGWRGHMILSTGKSSVPFPA